MSGFHKKKNGITQRQLVKLFNHLKLPIHIMRAFFHSFVFAWAGIVDFFKNHRNGQIHLFTAVLVVFMGLYFGLSKLEWSVIVLCIFMVTALEAMNSAIEYLTDLVSPDHHPLAGKVKDMAAGAVLLSAIGAAIIGIMVFWPYFMQLVR